MLPKDHILLLIPILSFNYQNWNFVLHQKIAFYCWFQFCCQFHLFIFPPAFATFIEFQNLHYSTILTNYFDSNKMYPIIYINSNNTKCTKVVVVTKGTKVLLFTNTNTKCTKVEPHRLDSCLGSFQDILIGIVGWMFLKWERFFSIAKTETLKWPVTVNLRLDKCLFYNKCIKKYV